MAWAASRTSRAATVAADFNGDEKLDLYVCNSPTDTEVYPNTLLIGDGKGGFTRSTAAAAGDAMSAEFHQSRACYAADFDGDNDVDLL
eukprot:4566782-Pyramimonas_sp.AAC.1